MKEEFFYAKHKKHAREKLLSLIDKKTTRGFKIAHLRTLNNEPLGWAIIRNSDQKRLTTLNRFVKGKHDIPKSDSGSGLFYNEVE